MGVQIKFKNKQIALSLVLAPQIENLLKKWLKKSTVGYDIPYIVTKSNRHFEMITKTKSISWKLRWILRSNYTCLWIYKKNDNSIESYSWLQ